ncbi:MAG: hypothetical protein ABR898_18150 [Terracidiphilus sp.]|jgi:FtsH-binding integral membrane protein
MIARRDLLKLLHWKRRTRRRVVMAYWAAVMAFVGAIAFILRRHGSLTGDMRLFWFFWAVTTAVPLMLFLIRRSLSRSSKPQTLLQPVKPDRESEDRPMDERAKYLSYRANAHAYVVLQLLLSLGVLWLMWMESTGLSTLRVPLLWLLYIAAFSLPQSMILWTEPDMETEAEAPTA